MKLIAGLGNPGKIYASSRHNIGFMAVEALARENKISLKRGFFNQFLSGKGNIAGQSVLIVKPLAFMNLSGTVLKPFLKKYKLDPKDILVICDDIDLEFGDLKIKPAGSSGGHRGLENIIDALGTSEFSRLRLGVGRPEHKQIDPADYVLSPFKKNELEGLKDIIEKAVACSQMWLEEGITKTMDTYNKRSKVNE